jgi:AcrR family transcriptional regulator
MLTGKQREIQERHELFLEVARTHLLEDGYEGLTIAGIAEATGFSKGTVYQRFARREELVVELGTRSRKRLHRMWEHAAQFPGRSRERIVAFGETFLYYSRHYPDDMRILAIITAESILEKVSEEQRSEMDALDARMFEIMLDIVQEAIGEGDLILGQGSTPQTVCLAFWALADGYFAAARGSVPLETAGIADPMEQLVRTGHYILDGYGWRPLYNEWDYEETSRRIRSTIFAEEAGPASVTDAG